ncbi:aldehyde dehydrogenase family protein [Microbacterium sp. MC2]
MTADLPEDVRSRVDAAVSDLRYGSRTWSLLTLGQRRTVLERIRAAVAATAAEWADVAATSKGLAPGHPLRGEEWLAGPYAALVALDAYAQTLTALSRGASPLDGVKVSTGPGGRTVVHTSPLSAIDRLLLSGFTTEVWLRPGVDADRARRAAGLAQRHPAEAGGVGLVLGAGNVTSIPFLDVLYELLAHNRVALLKVNPTQDALVPVFERVLAPLVEPGFLRIVTGGGEVGAYLTRHPSIDHVHITGSEGTFRAIVPGLTVPITAELGGVSPIIVVPGRWSAADLRFQAEHIATMRLQNSGHNCIAGQVVLVSSDWPQREAFLRELRAAYERVPQRPIWYPNSDRSMDRAREAYPDAETFTGGRLLVEVDAGADATAIESTEYFAPVLGVATLPGRGRAFLDAAVAHANEKLHGTLGANILIEPRTHAALGMGFEEALADLRYGTIAVNAWTAFGFLTPTATWGAFPGGTLEDAPSGIGVVHNALLLDDVERTIVRGPFRPFPRSLASVAQTRNLAHGSVLPTPPWFATARTGAIVSEGFTRFRADGNVPRLAVTMLQAFRA